MKATWKSMKRKICKRLSLLNKTIITLIIKYLSKAIFRQSIGWGKTQVFLSSLIRIHVDMPPHKLYSHCKNYFKMELFILFDCYWYSVHGIFHGILIYFSSPLSSPFWIQIGIFEWWKNISYMRSCQFLQLKKMTSKRKSLIFLIIWISVEFLRQKGVLS